MINKNFINNPLPAGIEDENIELYAYGNELYAICQGKKIHFMDLPEDILDMFRDHLINNTKALKALAKLNLVNDNAILKQYAWCNWGGWDKKADFYDGGKFGSEYWDCGQRGTCPFEGLICTGVKIGNGFLSRRELELVQHIATGKQDKEIAVLMNIAVTTISPFKEKIYQKIGLKKRTEIAVWAHKNNIV